MGSRRLDTPGRADRRSRQEEARSRPEERRPILEERRPEGRQEGPIPPEEVRQEEGPTPPECLHPEVRLEERRQEVHPAAPNRLVAAQPEVPNPVFRHRGRLEEDRPEEDRPEDQPEVPNRPVEGQPEVPNRQAFRHREVPPVGRRPGGVRLEVLPEERHPAAPIHHPKVAPPGDPIHLEVLRLAAPIRPGAHHQEGARVHREAARIRVDGRSALSEHLPGLSSDRSR